MVQSALTKTRGCCVTPALAGAVIGRGVFEAGFDVSRDDKKFGEIEAKGDGYVFSDNNGNTVVKAQVSSKRGENVATITDCGGKPIGKIIENAECYSSHFIVTGPDGAEVGRTGWVNSSSFALTSPTGEVVGAIANDHWFFDRFKLNTGKADPRILSILGVMNNAAAYRRSREDRIERGHEGPRRDI